MADVAIAPTTGEEPLVAKPAPAQWMLLRRVSFRFLCCYLILYCLPETGSLLYAIPGAPFVARPYIKLWHTICPWVAIQVFHVSGRPTTYFPTGSGDTTLAYVQNLLYVVFALAVALVWSILDRRRSHYRTLHSWLRLLVRYTLAFTLFGYGFAKIFPLQFRPAPFQRLIEPYGELSPMGALWSFMGASIPYIIFSGAVEVIGGLLLLFRRTTSLGAMVSFAVLLNIVVLNFCYDVPVKLYSVNLLLMCVFLAAPDLRRLANVLVFNRAAGPADLMAPRFERRWLRRAATAFWILLVGFRLFSSIQGGWAAYKQAYINPPRPPLYGLYEVETFIRNGRELPPLVTDATRWRKVAVSFPQFISIRMMDDSTTGYGASYDPSKNTVTLNKRDTLVWSRPDPDHVVLEGRLGGDTTLIRLRQIDTSKFLLVSRGFHWISEMPFNR